MKKADRTLIRSAATVAGMHVDPTVKHPSGLLVVRDNARCQSDQVLWNPLTDDGDAFRLAVKACFSIIQREHSVEVHIGKEVIHREMSPGGATRAELTRRAIVVAVTQLAAGRKL